MHARLRARDEPVEQAVVHLGLQLEGVRHGLGDRAGVDVELAVRALLDDGAQLFLVKLEIRAFDVERAQRALRGRSVGRVVVEDQLVVAAAAEHAHVPADLRQVVVRRHGHRHRHQLRHRRREALLHLALRHRLDQVVGLGLDLPLAVQEPEQVVREGRDLAVVVAERIELLRLAQAVPVPP